MAIFEKFPYLNFHSLNLDWLLKKTKEHTGEIEALDARIKALEDYPEIKIDVDFSTNIVTCNKTFEDIALHISSNDAVAEFKGLRTWGYTLLDNSTKVAFYFTKILSVYNGTAMMEVIEIVIPNTGNNSYNSYFYTMTLDS